MSDQDDAEQVRQQAMHAKYMMAKAKPSTLKDKMIEPTLNDALKNLYNLHTDEDIKKHREKYGLSLTPEVNDLSDPDDFKIKKLTDPYQDEIDSLYNKVRLAKAALEEILIDAYSKEDRKELIIETCEEALRELE